MLRNESDIDTVYCENCGIDNPVNEVALDDYKGSYFCDELCFDDWASDNQDIVTKHYKELNLFLS